MGNHGGWRATAGDIQNDAVAPIIQQMEIETAVSQAARFTRPAQANTSSIPSETSDPAIRGGSVATGAHAAELVVESSAVAGSLA